MNTAWETMLRSVEKRRDVDARFYKPVCLIAVIDGIEEGTLAPSDLDLDRVCARFGDYLEGVFPDRASFGWRPFWHLSRDGAWEFSCSGKKVGPDDFPTQRKPNSRRELTSRIDLVSVAPGTRSYWRSAADRAELRRAVIAMLERDDEACRMVASHLAAPRTDIEPAISGFVATSTDETAAGQGFQVSAIARRAVELRAMSVAANFMGVMGWTTEDVSASKPYDLLCRRGSEIRYVEVKGTVGLGDQVQLTANEVAFAHANRADMILIVVSKIRLKESSGGGPIGSGGNLRMISSWAPTCDQLTPISYRCGLPGATQSWEPPT